MSKSRKMLVAGFMVAALTLGSGGVFSATASDKAEDEKRPAESAVAAQKSDQKAEKSERDRTRKDGSKEARQEERAPVRDNIWAYGPVFPVGPKY